MASMSYLGGTLELKYDEQSGFYVSRFTLPDGTRIQSLTENPSVPSNYTISNYVYEGSTVVSVLLSTPRGSNTITDRASIDSLLSYADNTVQTRNAINQLFQEIQPPPSPEPPTPTITNTPTTVATPAPTSTNTLAGPASDDSGTGQGVTTGTETTATTTSTPTTPTATVNDTDAPSANAPENTEREGEESTTGLGDPGDPPYENEGFKRGSFGENTRPGRRLQNPLGNLSSYTYQLSLYMVSPKGYEAFMASGRKNIFALNDASPEVLAEARADNAPAGVFLIAQSAGMGNSKYRAKGFELDYYIDNLSFEAFIAPKSAGGPVPNTSYKFKIVEPYGFSFVTKLKRAQEALVASSGGKGTEQYLESAGTNPTKMFYVLGIRFFGYDQEGNQVTGSEVFDGQELDPNAGAGGALFETFYDIVITEFKFKIDGNATTYNISAETASISSTINQTKGFVPDNKSTYGTTVRDMFSGPSGLLTQLNKDQQALVENGTKNHPIIYRVQWLGDNARRIALGRLNTPEKTNKNNQPGSNVENPAQSNDATATTATPNKDQVKHDVTGGIPIVQAMEQIIVRSSYITDAMSVNYTDANENNPDTDAPDSERGAGREVTWFSINPQITDIKWDTKVKDWAYTITYVIQPYLVPQIESPYVVGTTKYYGPHKRYDYWYTGQNTEIIGYEQQINNQFFIAVLGDTQNDSGGDGNTSNNPNQGGKNATNTQANGDKAGAQGTPSLEAANSFRTSLYDPSSFATAKIDILGDPDFLLHDTTAGTLGGGTNSNTFYETTGYRVNPSVGQVFIEIDFKEAIDYSRDGNFPDDEEGIPPVEGAPGTLAINDSIEFWRYAEGWEDKIKGVSYQVISVSNTFQNGGFKQRLNTVINPLAAKDAQSEEAREETAGTTASTEDTANAAPTANTAATGNTAATTNGLRNDPAILQYGTGPLATGYVVNRPSTPPGNTGG